MAFSVAARVRCTDQSSHFRGKLGTVISVTGDAHQVRPDGFLTAQAVTLQTSQLIASSIASPIDYSDE
jgi:hypothetical protein